MSQVARGRGVGQAPGQPRTRGHLAEASSRAELMSRAVGGRLSAERRRALVDALSELGLERLARLEPVSLMAECGVTRGQAERLAAMFELGREVERSSAGRGVRAGTPAEAFRVLSPELRGLEVESFRVLVLDVRGKLIGHREVSRGTLNGALVHPREVFRLALRIGGASLVVAHNHPSGDPEPSSEDWVVTHRLIRAGRVLGVPLADHLVVAGQEWVSLRSRDRWPAEPGRGGGLAHGDLPVGLEPCIEGQGDREEGRAGG